jgi:hypothetical protein
LKARKKKRKKTQIQGSKEERTNDIWREKQIIKHRKQHTMIRIMKEGHQEKTQQRKQKTQQMKEQNNK